MPLQYCEFLTIGEFCKGAGLFFYENFGERAKTFDETES